jgi:diphthamide synthase (EF-2-diphthine--ammonia ligase)
MKKDMDAAKVLHGYLLSEEQHQRLQQMCDHLLLMSEFVLATTEEEESELLQIRRSRLGWLFESFGIQLEQLLLTVQWAGRGK